MAYVRELPAFGSGFTLARELKMDPFLERFDLFIFNYIIIYLPSPPLRVIFFYLVASTCNDPLEYDIDMRCAELPTIATTIETITYRLKSL
jgi:hypothetical protein